MAYPDVFKVLCQDRHTDPEMEVFEKQEDAIAHARKFAQENSRDGTFEEEMTETIARAGWVFYASYGEDNSVRVEKGRVR